jgi:hypothetical protein
MIIGGYQAFHNLVNNDNIASFASLKNCVTTVSKICNCQKARKNAKIEECERTYINIVHGSLSNMVEYFKSKTEDSEIVFYHGGSHELLRLKLR